jgi:hypothetical protein
MPLNVDLPSLANLADESLLLLVETHHKVSSYVRLQLQLASHRPERDIDSAILVFFCA